MKNAKKAQVTIGIPALEYKKLRKFARAHKTTVKAMMIEVFEKIGNLQKSKKKALR
jgi:hypothetical protein